VSKKTKERRGCAACGDIGFNFEAIGERFYCRACFREKTEGVIPRGTVSFCGGGLPAEPASQRRYDGGHGSETLNRFRP